MSSRVYVAPRLSLNFINPIRISVMTRAISSPTMTELTGTTGLPEKFGILGQGQSGGAHLVGEKNKKRFFYAS